MFRQIRQEPRCIIGSFLQCRRPQGARASVRRTGVPRARPLNRSYPRDRHRSRRRRRTCRPRPSGRCRDRWQTCRRRGRVGCRSARSCSTTWTTRRCRCGRYRRPALDAAHFIGRRPAAGCAAAAVVVATVGRPAVVGVLREAFRGRWVEIHVSSDTFSAGKKQERQGCFRYSSSDKSPSLSINSAASLGSSSRARAMASASLYSSSVSASSFCSRTCSCICSLAPRASGV